MTEVEALCHAGIYKHTPPEIMDEIVRFMPGYLWIVDDYYGDVGLPEFDMPTHGRRARLIHCGVCGQEQVEESRRGGRYAVKYAQNDGIMCPFCCEFVTVKHVSRGIKGVTDRLDAVYYQKSAVNSRALVAFAARCERRFADADAREPWALEAREPERVEVVPPEVEAELERLRHASPRGEAEVRFLLAFSRLGQEFKAVQEILAEVVREDADKGAKFAGAVLQACKSMIQMLGEASE